jgi:hypothetical protein
VALLVPTWCIETWLLHLSGIAQPAESVQVKEDPAFRPAMKLLEAAEAQHIQTSAAVFLTFAPSPASLVDARVEARRIGIP